MHGIHARRISASSYKDAVSPVLAVRCREETINPLASVSARRRLFLSAEVILPVLPVVDDNDDIDVVVAVIAVVVPVIVGFSAVQRSR